MAEFRGSWIYWKSSLQNVSELPDITCEVVVYEVIRVMGGVALFLEDHLNRLHQSGVILQHEIIVDSTELESSIKKLSETNGFMLGNILLKYFIRTEGEHWMLYYIPHSYPSEKDYMQGVSVGLLQGVRENPQAKVANLNVRKLADKAIREFGVYEVLLVDHNGYITEGSRSNVFFVKGETVYSAKPELFLKGITFLKVVEICRENNIHLVFDNIEARNLARFDAVFLTGTSPKILPVSVIENNRYNAMNELVVKISKEYDRMIEDYLKKWRND